MAICEVYIPQLNKTLDLDDDRWRDIPRSPSFERSRLAWAAAHLVLLPEYASVDPWENQEEIVNYIDWGATQRIRQYLADRGFGIAEAMDTAQRYELGWPAARKLIENCLRVSADLPFIAGAGADQLGEVRSIGDLVEAVAEQVKLIQRYGGVAMILAMPWLSVNKCSEDDYVETYCRIVDHCNGPLLIHWLGEQFLPELAGYFPGNSFDRIMRHDPGKVRGAKLSIINPVRERQIRQDFLGRDQFVLTGDDWNFSQLLIEDNSPAIKITSFAGIDVPLGNFSHALLGVLGAIAGPARIALEALADGRHDDARLVLDRCEQLGRKIFEPPTVTYKAGIALLAWLNGLQDTFLLVNHLQNRRDLRWYAEVLELANDAGAIVDAPLAAARAAEWFASQA